MYENKFTSSGITRSIEIKLVTIKYCVCLLYGPIIDA